MENGTTYMVRPRIAPSNSLPSVAFISPGSTQLLVGPAASLLMLQMNVRSSTRATSLGSDRARKQPGRFSGFRRVNVPACTNSSHMASYSAGEPSHQWMLSGLHSAAISMTQAFSRALRT